MPASQRACQTVGLGLPQLCLWVGVPLNSCTVILAVLVTAMLAVTLLWLVDMTGTGGQCPVVHDTSFCGFSIVIGVSPTVPFPLLVLFNLSFIKEFKRTTLQPYPVL